VYSAGRRRPPPKEGFDQATARWGFRLHSRYN